MCELCVTVFYIYKSNERLPVRLVSFNMLTRSTFMIIRRNNAELINIKLPVNKRDFNTKHIISMKRREEKKKGSMTLAVEYNNRITRQDANDAGGCACAAKSQNKKKKKDQAKRDWEIIMECYNLIWLLVCVYYNTPATAFERVYMVLYDLSLRDRR